MLLGVDAGGTSCRARLVDANGTVLGTGIAGPANTRLGAPFVVRALMSCCMQALARAGLDERALSEIIACVGIAGYSRSGVVRDIESDAFFQSLKASRFVSDAYTAHVGAHAYNDGGTVIIGTGSVAIATVADLKVQIGGKGFPSSDLGSGAHMGLLAIQHALLVKDGVQPAGALSSEILLQADDHASDLHDYIDAMDPTDYARRAPLVVSHAAAGDAAAVRIMKECARHVDEMLLHLQQIGASRLCLVGGLGPTMERWVSQENRRHLVEPFGDPIDGAIVIAADPSRTDGDLQSPATCESKDGHA